MDDHFVDSIFCRQVDVKNLSESYDQKAMTYKMMKHNLIGRRIHVVKSDIDIFETINWDRINL